MWHQGRRPPPPPHVRPHRPGTAKADRTGRWRIHCRSMVAGAVAVEWPRRLRIPVMPGRTMTAPGPDRRPHPYVTCAFALPHSAGDVNPIEGGAARAPLTDDQMEAQPGNDETHRTLRRDDRVDLDEADIPRSRQTETQPDDHE